jgi:hypothetical protein
MSGEVCKWAAGSFHPSPVAQLTACATFPVIADCFDRTASQSLLACRPLGFILGLLADIRIGVLKRASEVVGSSFAADIAIDASRIDVKGAVCVLFDFVVWVGHESAGYADFSE